MEKRRIDCMTCAHFDRWSDSCPFCQYKYDETTDCEQKPFAGKIEINKTKFNDYCRQCKKVINEGQKHVKLFVYGHKGVFLSIEFICKRCWEEYLE